MRSYPKGVTKLIASLDNIPTLKVSCVAPGKGKEPLMIFFEIRDYRYLFIVGRAIDRNYGGYGFRCEMVSGDLPEHAVSFLLVTNTGGDLRGPSLKGAKAYNAASALADRIDYLLSPSALFIRQHYGLE